MELQSYRTRFHKLSTPKQLDFGMKFRHVFSGIVQKDKDLGFCFVFPKNPGLFIVLLFWFLSLLLLPFLLLLVCLVALLQIRKLKDSTMHMLSLFVYNKR